MHYFSKEGKNLIQFSTGFSNVIRIYTKHTEATFEFSFLNYTGKTVRTHNLKDKSGCGSGVVHII